MPLIQFLFSFSAFNRKPMNRYVSLTPHVHQNVCIVMLNNNLEKCVYVYKVPEQELKKNNYFCWTFFNLLFVGDKRVL